MKAVLIYAVVVVLILVLGYYYYSKSSAPALITPSAAPAGTYSPKVGDTVGTTINVSGLSGVCVSTPKNISFYGTISAISGNMASVQWNVMSSPGCSGSPWQRGAQAATSPSWDSQWLGSAGVPPTMIPNLPNPIAISALVPMSAPPTQ